MTDRPLLRPIDFQPVQFRGESMWLLRDPLQLSDRQLIFPPALAQILPLCDGEHTPADIQQVVSQRLGFPLDYDIVLQALAQLDQAYLLDNGRSQEARHRLLLEYRRQAHRPPALAGLGYAGEPAALASELAGYGVDQPDGQATWRGRGVISPHIDFRRGGPVYARVWRQAAAAAREADLVLMFGTDHSGGPGSITLTRQAYATPFGVLPTDAVAVDALAEAIGPARAFALELNHRHEHAIELSAVWLHYVAGDQPPPLVPILCGSFQHFVDNGAHPANDETLNAFLAALKELGRGRRVLAVASVDLAHVGPSFGDPFAMDQARRERLQHQDESLLEAISQGDAARFYAEIAAIQDRNRICGFSSIYLLLRFLDSVEGVTVAYEQCPADPRNESLVSICGLLLN